MRAVPRVSRRPTAAVTTGLTTWLLTQAHSRRPRWGLPDGEFDAPIPASLWNYGPRRRGVSITPRTLVYVWAVVKSGLPDAAGRRGQNRGKLTANQGFSLCRNLNAAAGVSILRSSCKWPRPVADLRHILSVLGDVCLMLDELLAHRLFHVGGLIA